VLYVSDASRSEAEIKKGRDNEKKTNCKIRIRKDEEKITWG
jgi:hypothetical protein